MKALMRQINDDPFRKSHQLNITNARWGAKGYPFRYRLLKLVKDEYVADLKNVDFAKDAEGARGTTNGWIKNETIDKIRELIASGILDENTRLVLTNGIYFNADWSHQFRKARTKTEPFHLPLGMTAKASLMNQTAKFGFAETDDFQVVELPYANAKLSVKKPMKRCKNVALSERYTGDGLAMLMLLPKHSDVAELEKS